MKKLLYTLFLCFISAGLFASGHIAGFQDPLLKTFITNTHKTPDGSYQQELRSGSAWAQFVQQHPGWWVQFNEENQKPSRAVGSPVTVNVFGTPKDKALAFINTNLQAFQVPVNDLVMRNTASTNKHHYVNFYQTYQGLEVLWSNVTVKMLKSNDGVILFGLGCYSNIQASIQPAITDAAAKAAAETNVSGIKSSLVNPDLKILPIPGFRNYSYKLVYEVTVNNVDAYDVPGKYYTLVDASTGEVLYRENKVSHFANTDVTITANITPKNPYQPNAVLPVKNAPILDGSNLYYTDNTGYVAMPNLSPASVTISLEGMYSKIETNGVTPSYTTTVNPGVNNLVFTTPANIKELSAYNSVNDIHEYLNQKLNFFQDMDFPMVTHIDVAGSCNAFYDGDLNFFDVSVVDNCGATSVINDVVYHEYGHGINDYLYQFYGGSFGNGAMGEGYADTWANGLTNDPILGIGFYLNNPTGFVRRYDQNPKVYPQDLVGEVHADGEIIAGAWWDYGLAINDRQLAIDLFAETFAATITGASGTEGQLYTDVLIEAITNDDNDGNLNNGTPHLSQLLSSFAMHGITLMSNVTFTHTEVLTGADLTPIPINVTFAYTSQFPWFTASPEGRYRVNQGSWNPFPISNVSGNSFSGNIPAQLAGDVVSYYLVLVDGSGGVLQTLPAAASDADPNIPYYAMIDFTPLITDDLEGSLSGWTLGLPSDNAVTGNWIFDLPVGSFTNGIICQPDDQHTPGGFICAVTGNALPNDPIGTNDLDSGLTTLISPVFDLSNSINPGFSFYRWYTNDQGSTPKTESWQVSISGDGTNWVPVELTKTPDHSWRRFAFRVKDYITPTATVSIRFIAEDDAAEGSLVEAAVDDLVLYDATTTGIADETENNLFLTVYPNPATDAVNISWNQKTNASLAFNITNNIGEIVYTIPAKNWMAGAHQLSIPVEKFGNGIYFMQVKGNKINEIKKITILK